MSNFKDDFLGGIGIFIVIALTLLFFIGSYHAFDKHKDGSLTIYVFPWGWYRGVEFFWHNDFAGVDWDKKLKNDTKSCIYFIDKAGNNDVNVNKLNSEMEEFSKLISKYPNEKKDYLKLASESYYKYALSLTQDMFEYIKRSEYDKDIVASSKTIELENELSKYLQKEDIELYSKGKNEYFLIIKKFFENQKFESFDNNIFDLLLKKSYNEFKHTYKNLFNEEYIK